MVTSNGHIAFVGNRELWLADNGDLYISPVDNAVMPDGRRSGRWEAPKHMARARVNMIQGLSAGVLAE